jgi:hypothetical protein
MVRRVVCSRVDRFSSFVPRAIAAAALATVFAAAIPASASAQSARLDPARAAARLRDERLLLLVNAQFDPLAQRAPLPDALRWTAADSAPLDYFVVQLRSKPVPSDHLELSTLGAQELEYLPNDAFLVRAATASLPALVGWPRTRAIVPFEPGFRIAPSLLARATAAGRALLDVSIRLFAGADPAAATLAMRELGIDLPESDAGARERLLARMPADRLVALARIRDVQWVQLQSVPVMRNSTTTWVIQSNVTDKTPVWDQGILGQDVIIGHIDGAIDLDSCYFDDPNVTNPGPTHRKVVSHHGSHTNPDSHGTHTAGTAAGDQEPITGVIDDNGIAYHARLAHTNLSLITSTNLDTKLAELYTDGARVFTNSWGDDSTTDYNDWPHDIDEFCWTNDDALVCFAVSNGSVVTNPENSKNCLAVGASDQAPNQTDHCSGGSGPTVDGRRKPEIYAPGCNISSASAGHSCATELESGTSMASPAIAGAAALAKEYFEAGFWPTGVATAGDEFTPSGALLKAILIDAAVDMTGVSGYPTDLEGWGRLLLDRSLMFSGDRRSTWLVDVPFAKGFAASGESQTHFVHVNTTTTSLEVSLCFMDKSGAVNSATPVVNDLDLEVLAPDGSTYLGNVFKSGESKTGGSADPLNDVERVRIGSPPVGWYAITIRATTIATSRNQGYALVATGELDPPFEGGFTTYGSGTQGTGGFVPNLAGSGSGSIGEDATLDITNGRGGASGLLLIGFARANLAFAGGELLVLPPWIVLPIQLGGTSGVGGAGSLSLTDTIPADPNFVGALVDFQAVIADPAATKGLALSNGLELTIGS